MKLKYAFLSFTIALIFVVLVTAFPSNMIKISAISTGFETSQIPTDTKDSFIYNINLQLITEEPTKRTLGCFDVNENGDVAVGHSTGSSKKQTVCIYSSDGFFKYGYTFNCTGDFGIEWAGENINIYFVRSDMIVSVALDGKILNVCEVEDTIANNSYRNHRIYATEKKIQNTTYSLKNNIGLLDWFATSYSQIVAIDTSGNQNIIYDVSSTQITRTTALFIVILCALITAAFTIRSIVKVNSKT